VDEFCRHAKLPLELQGRVKRFLQHEWHVQRGADPNKALAELPPMLRLQLKMEICGDAIRRTPFFQRASDQTLLAVVSALRFETYPPGEAIFVQGQIGEKLYIIARGLVAIQLPPKDPSSTNHRGSIVAAGVNASTVNGTSGTAAGSTGDAAAAAAAAARPAAAPTIVKTVGKGSWFGEAALLKSGRRSASAVAHTSCDLLVVARKDFLRVCEADPTFAEHLRAIMEQRLQTVQRKKQLAGINALGSVATFQHQQSNHWARGSMHSLNRAPTAAAPAAGEAVEMSVTGREVSTVAANGIDGDDGGAPRAFSPLQPSTPMGSSDSAAAAFAPPAASSSAITSSAAAALLGPANRLPPMSSGSAALEKRRQSLFTRSPAAGAAGAAAGVAPARGRSGINLLPLVPSSSSGDRSNSSLTAVAEGAPRSSRIAGGGSSSLGLGGGGGPLLRSLSFATTTRDHRAVAQQREKAQAESAARLQQMRAHMSSGSGESDEESETDSQV